jgi:hypothetical protein
VPAGFIHASCSGAYFGTGDVLPRIRHFARALSDADVREIEAELQHPASSPPASP